MPSSERRDSQSDPLLGLVAGLSLALLAAPPAVLIVARTVSTDAAVLYSTLLVVLAVVTGLGWRLVGRWRHRLVSVGESHVRWLPPAIGIGYAVAGFASLGTTGVLGVVAFFFGLFAMVAGFVLGAMLTTRYVDAAVEAATVSARWRAGWPTAAKRRLLVAAGVVVSVTAAAFIVGIVRDVDWLRTLGQTLFPFGVVIVTVGEERDYAATDVGLVVSMPVARRRYAWSRFEGYSRTDDALVLHRPLAVDLRFSLADIDDPDAVEAALARYLDRHDAQ